MFSPKGPFSFLIVSAVKLIVIFMEVTRLHTDCIDPMLLLNLTFFSKLSFIKKRIELKEDVLTNQLFLQFIAHGM